MSDLTITNSGVITYILANFACFLFMLPILRKVTTTVGREMEAKLFFVMICMFLIHLFTDSAMLFFPQLYAISPAWICSVITIADELSLLFVGFFWFLFGWVRLQLHYFDDMRFKVLILIPCIIDIFFAVLSPWKGYIFSIDNHGIYARGPFYFVQVCAVFSYIVLICTAAVIKSHKEKSTFDKNKDLSLIKFMITPAVAGILQIINYQTPIMNLGLALGIYYVYIDMLAMQVFNDSLTGLNNRRKAQYYFTDCLKEASEKPFYVFMIDVDYFKEINDKYGHAEGDRALCMVASSLKDTAGQYDGFAARLGGDEFVMSAFISSGIVPEEMTNIINEKIQRSCKEMNVPYTVNLSVGFMKCDSDQITIMEVLQKADEMQYKSKREHHRWGE